jgi:glycosyltransferase involved in cell wall biosynthesis
MKRLSIAIYQPRVSYYHGGGEVIPLEYARLFSERGDIVTIVTTHPIDGKIHPGFSSLLEKNKNISVIYLIIPERHKKIYETNPGIDWLRWDMEAFIMGREAYKYFLENKFDVVSVHYQGDMIAIPEGQKSVLRLHGYPNEPRYDYNYWLSLPDRFVADSEYIREQWQKIYNFTKPIKVLPNGINSSIYYPKNCDKKIDILFVGRLIEIKGVQYLIKSIKTLVNEGLKPKVSVAGDGPYKKVLEDQVKSEGLSEYISFLGFVPDEQIVDLYRSAKVCVLPSYDREGIITTMLEAGACGIPEITTTAASMKEYMVDGEYGFLVKPKDDKGITKALMEQLTNDELRNKISSNIAEYTREFWTWDEKFKGVQEIYEQTA